MSFDPNPKQALLLWKLLTAESREEREPLKSKTRPALNQRELKPLLDYGFVTLEKWEGKRGDHVVLADRAWAWAANTVNVELLKSRSSCGAEALQGLLRRLLPFLKQHDLALASLFLDRPDGVEESKADDVRSDGATSAPAGQSASQSLPARIEAACLSLSGGVRKTRVRLSALRQELASVERSELDAALLRLQDEGRLVLYRDDNSAALTEDDHRAALLVGGAPRHLVYLEG